MKKGNLLNRFKRFNRINRLFLILAAVIAGSGNVWGNSWNAKVTANVQEPSGGGKVYVGKTQTAPSQDQYKTGTDDAGDDGVDEKTTKTYYLYSLDGVGYKFTQWYEGATALGDTQGLEICVNKDNKERIITATYTAKTYTVYLNNNGGSGTVPSTVTATFDAAMPTISSFTAPTKNGYDFGGYSDATSGGTKYYNANGTSAKNWDKDQNNATLYAIWTGKQYAVTLSANGGSGGTSVSATYGSAMPSASAPTRNGFTFLGYYDGNGTQYYNAGMASVRNWDKTAATTLYAQWSAYQVNYNLNYEGANQTNYFTGWTETVTSSGLTLAYDPATGFITINGTSTSSAGPIIQEMPGIAAGEVISYAATDYAGTRSSANGCQVFETCNFYGTAASSPRQNLDFRGNTSKTNQTVQSGYNYMKFWIWYSTEAVTYTNLKFKLRLEKASSLASIAAPSGKYVVKGQAYGTLANDPVRDGYYFEGWYTAAEGGDKVESTTIFNGSANQVLYAHWSEVKTYILGDVTSKTTHTGGQIYISSGGVTDITKVPEASWTQHDFGGPNNGKSHKYYLFARPFTGYSFTKWTAEDGTQLSTSTTFTPTVTNNPEDKVLQKTVQYYAIFTIHSWTLTWAGIDGATVSGTYTPAGTTNYGTALTAPTVSKAGWKFTGWNPTVPATMPDANSTYTAQWSAVTVSGAAAQTVNFTGRTETKTATLEFTVANASSANDFNAPTVSGDAGWTVKSWSYANNKVSVVMTFTATENTTTSGNHVATVTLKAKSNNQATGTVTANVNMIPAYTNNIKSSYLVEETTLDLNALWTSTSSATKTYTITEFTPSGSTTGGTTPTISNNKIALTQSGTLKLKLTQPAGTSGPGGEQTCTVIINKRDNAISTTYAGTMYMGATQNVTVSATNTTTAITFTQTAGSDIATLNSAKTQVTSYANLGTATWKFSQAENYKFKKPADATMSINVVKAAETECVSYKIDKVSISSGEHDEVHDMVNSEKITFTTRIGGGSVSNVFWVDLYINNAWVNIFETSSEQAWTLTDSRIKSATKVRFSAEGTINKYFDNIVIYRHKYIAPTESITIDKKANNEPIYIGESGTGTMTVKWSTCNGGTLKLSSSNPKFTLSQTTITEATDGTGGTKDITITYSSPDAGTDKATIVVYNDAHRAEAQVTGITVKKTPSMSWWNAANPLTLSTQDGAIHNPVIDITEGCDYTMTVSQAGYVTLDNTNKIITPVNPTPADTYITLTATIDNHDYYGQITKQIAVTNLMAQEITWNQSFYNLKATSPATTVQLNATAQTTVSYQSSDPTVVSVSGTTLTVLKKGTCYLTATAAEGGGYAKADMQKQVIVRNEGESCEPTEVFGTYKVSEGNDAWIPAPFPSKKFEMQVIRGEAISSRNMWVYARYADGSESQLDKFNPPASAEGYNKSYDIASNVTYIRLHSDANNEMKVREGRWTMAQTMSVSPETISFECTTTESKTNTFTATYSNIQGPLVYTSENPYITFNPLSNTQGDCGDMGTKTITITYAPAEVQDKDYKITVWDGTTASMKRDITVHCKSTAATQSMSWTQDFSAAKKTTDLITFDATTNAVRTEENLYPVVYTSSNTSVATIDGNKLNILSSGTVTITASQDGKDANGRQRYNAVQMQKTITIEKVTPDIATNPTTSAFTYGSTLSSYSLNGGKATVTYQGAAGTQVAGTFAWTTPTQVVQEAAGTQSYSVTFTPSNTNLYNTKVFTISTTVNRATPTMSAENKAGVKLSLTSENQIALVNQITTFSPASDAYGHQIAKSAIDYTVSTNPGSAGHVTSDKKFYATAAGTYTITASSNATSYYTAQSTTFTITVEKLDNTVLINGQSSQTVEVNCGRALDVKFTSSHNETTYNVTKTSGVDAISYAAEKITAAAGSSNKEAVFTVTQPESTHYKSGTATITIHVKPVFHFAAVAEQTGEGATAGSVSASVAKDTQYENYGTTSSSTTATYTATPNKGYTFEGWKESESGAVVSTDNPYQPTITNNSAESTETKTLYATWQLRHYSFAEVKVIADGVVDTEGKGGQIYVSQTSKAAGTISWLSSYDKTDTHADASATPYDVWYYAKPDRANKYVFVGWSKSVTGSPIETGLTDTTFQTQVDKFTNDPDDPGKITYYAVFKKGKTYTARAYSKTNYYEDGRDNAGLMYVSMNGSVPTSDTWKKSNVLDYSTGRMQPTLDASHTYTAIYYAKEVTGYTFTGWTDEKANSHGLGDANNDYKLEVNITSTSEEVVEANTITRIANFQPKTYDITLNANGGSPNGTAKVTFDDTKLSTMSFTATRAGYTLSGFYTAANGGSQVADNAGNLIGGVTDYTSSGAEWKRDVASTTLYAHWAGIQYTVTLDPNYDGGKPTDIQATYGSDMPGTQKLSRTGHKFLGYYDAKEGGTQYYNESGASVHAYDKIGASTLYAHWEGADFFTWNGGAALSFEALSTIPNSVATAFSGRAVTYTSAEPTIVEVQADGSLLAKKAGDVSITATTAADPTGYFAVLTESKTFTITKAPQTIVWEQNFGGMEVGDAITLTAKAVGANGKKTDAVLNYSVANTSIAKVENGQIIALAKGSTTITVTATSEVYDEASKTMNVAVRTAGEPCNTTTKAFESQTQFSGSGTSQTVTILPYDSISFYAWRSIVLIGDMSLTLHDPNGATVATYTLNADSTDMSKSKLFKYKVPNNGLVKTIKLETSSDITYFNVQDVTLKQASYLTTNIKEGEFEHEHTIYTDYSHSFEVYFSDKPAVNATVTNHNGLEIVREETEDIGGCGAYGTYHYTIRSTEKWTTPRTVKDTIFFTTTVGDKIVVPIKLTVKAGSSYIFVNTTGDHDWFNLNNWTEGEGGDVPAHLPAAMNTVVIKELVNIDSPVEVYAVEVKNSQTFETHGDIVIEPTGGMTVYKGVSNEELHEHLTVKSSIENTGYFRISPNGVTLWKSKYPNFTMQYATKATLDNGANKNAKWQYFGIPVDNYDFTVDYITWLNEWDETNSKGWIKHNNESEPVNMKAFKGYEITQYGQPVYEFTGAIRMDSVTLTLTNTSSGKHGDNIIANSFPAPIDVTLFTDDDFSEGVEKTFYIYNSGSWNQWKQHQDSDTWQSDNPGAFTAIPIKSADLMGKEVQTLIPPMQAICMWTAKEGTVKLNYAKHVWYASEHSSKDDMNAGLRAPSRVAEDSVQMTEAEIEVAREKAIRDSLARASREREKTLTHRARITFTSENSGADHVYLLERNGFTTDFENGYDAYKMWGSGSTMSTYAGIDSENLMSVWATNNLVGTYIGVDAGEDTTYYMKVSSVIGDSLYLKDLTNDAEIDIVEGQTYTFNAEPETYNEQRFIVLKREPTIPTGITEHNSSSNAYIWADAHNLHIENAGTNSVVELFAADGKLLYSETIHRRADISIDQLAQSMYLVYVDGKPLKFVKK